MKKNKVNALVISDLINKKSLTQLEFSDLLKINSKTFNSWLTRGSVPKYDQVLEIAKLLGVSPSVIELRDGIVEEPQTVYKKQTLSTRIPFYNVDFTANFDVVDVYTRNIPDDFINDPLFKGSDFVVRCNGDSMTPKIPVGCYMGLKKIDLEDIHFGSIYAIVTDSWRTVKYIRKIKGVTDKVMLVPENTENYDEQELKIDKILSIWLVLAHGVKLH